MNNDKPSIVISVALAALVSACGSTTGASAGADAASDAGAGVDAGPAGDTGIPDAGGVDAGTPRLYRAVDGVMKTRDGHVLFLRGVNYSGTAKDAPGHLAGMTPEDLSRLVAFGANSVRLLTFWNAVAPDAADRFDQAYLAAYVERVKMLDDAGFSIIIDMHQDLWGEPFVVHGAPAWACPAEIADGYAPSSPWWANYVSDQVTGCFDNLYRDTALQDAYAAAWVEVARAVCPFERVVGFDILNEPWPGSGLTDATFDNKVLMPFYKRVMAAIEDACPGRLYFTEPSAAFTFGFAKELRVPAGFEDRVVVSPHFYPPEVHEPGTEGYKGPVEDLDRRFLDVIGGYLDKGVPLWMGEFGGVNSNPGFAQYMRDIHELLSAHWVPSAIWDYCRGGGFCLMDDAGALNGVFTDVYTTPVPLLLPSKGTLSTDWSAGSMKASFDCAPGRGMTVLLTAATSTCSAEPAGVLGAFAPGPGFSRADCLTPGAVTVTCAR